MGETTPPDGVPVTLHEAILDMCLSARRTGRVIDVAEEAARLLKEFPVAGLDKALIGEAIVREATLHHGVTLILNARKP